MSGSARFVAGTLARSVRRHRVLVGGTVFSTAIGILLTTLVAGLVLSILTAIRSGTAVTNVDADVVVSARAPAGLDEQLADAVVGSVPGADALPAVIVNTRIAGDTAAVLTIIGVTGRAEQLMSEFGPEHVERAGTDDGLIVSREWADGHGVRAGGVVRLSGAGGVVSLPVAGVTSQTVPNEGAIAVAPRSLVSSAFRRPGIDAVFVRARDGADPAALVPAIQGVVGGAATVGTVDEVVDAEQSSFAFIRLILLVVGAAGIATASGVVFACWRIAIAAERPVIAKLRLAGASPRALIAGTAVLFLATVLAAAIIGVPIGLLASSALVSFAQQSVTFTGLAAAATAPEPLVPALAGAGGGLLVAAVGWLAGMRGLLQVSTIEAVRPTRAGAHAPGRPGLRAALGLAFLVGSLLVSQSRATAATGAALALVIAAVVLLSQALPAVWGAVAASRGSFRSLSTGRDLQRGARSHRGVLTILSIALTLAIALAGLATSLGSGLDSSIKAWTGGDLYVLPARPTLNLRDEKFPPSVAADLAALPGVKSVLQYTLSMMRYKDRNVQLWAWSTDGVEDAVDLEVADGKRGPELWGALDDGAVAVSTNFALLHDLEVGDTVDLPGAAGTVPSPIVALVNDYSGDTGVVIMSFAGYTRLTGDDRSVDLLVNLQPGADRDAVSAAVSEKLSGYPQLTVWTGDRMRSELMGILGQVLAILQALGFIVALLAVLMGVTSSSAGLITRTRESALLRLYGATRRWISGSLLTEAIWLGLMAWSIAVLCGLVAVKPMVDVIGMTSKTYPPTVLPLAVVAAMAPLSVVAMLLAHWLPSRRMLDADVAEALAEEV